MTDKKRKYYSHREEYSAKKGQLVYLLRYQDSGDAAIKNEGPFDSEDNAKDRLSVLLRKGICSWLVTYNE
jgi:hypothetical protein